MRRTPFQTDLPVIALTLFLSGFCGIAYEVLYARILGNVIGDHFAVNASILVTFLLGIGLGTRFAYYLKPYLWAVEMGVGLYALFFTALAPKLDLLLYQVFPFGSLTSDVVVACLLLLVPAFLVGVSLPLFSAYLQPLVKGRVFTISYMVYNFGAALTALLIEFVLIRAVGIRSGLVVIAGINLSIGLILFLRRKGIQGRLRPHKEVPYSFRKVVPLVLLSFASAVFQLTMLKLAEFIFGPFHETFAMVLGMVLLGIAIGTLVTHYFKVRFITFLIVNLMLILTLIFVFPQLLYLMATFYPHFTGSAIIGWKLLILFLIMGGSAICFGAAIPALMQRESDVARESGYLLFVSSLANTAGYLVMIFFIHARLEYGSILLLMALLLVGAIGFSAEVDRRKLILAGLLLVSGFLMKERRWKEYLLYLDYQAFTSQENLFAQLSGFEEGEFFRKYDETFAVNRLNGREYFFINGYTSIDLNSSPEYVVGTLSALVTPRRETGLVLGLGSGATAGTVTELFQTVDAVEISPLILEKQPLFRQYSFDIMAKENVRVYCDDGFRFLKVTPKKYDLILNTVTSPLYFSSSKLYTRDFFRSVKQRLAKDGIYTTWLDRRVGERGLKIILTTLKTEFQYCWVAVLRPEYYLLLCSNEPLRFHDPEPVFGNQTLKDYFYRVHGRPMDSYRYAIVNTDAYRYLNPEESIRWNSIDFPNLEFEMARRGGSSLQGFEQFIFNYYSLDQMQREVFGDAVDLNLLVSYFSLEYGESVFARFFQKLAQEKDTLFLDQYRTFVLDFFRQRMEEFGTMTAALDYGRWLEQFNRIPEAIQLYQRLVESHPEGVDLSLKIAQLQFRQQGYIEARETLEQVLKAKPENGEAWFWLGRIALAEGQFPQAIGHIQKALVLQPGLDDGNYYLGVALMKLGQPDSALVYYERELQRDPGDMKAKLYLMQYGGND
jgi:spermidine synthase/tetratricopeptide (TPR) repeat protein